MKVLDILICALLSLDAAGAGCVQIGGNRILVRHLTAALPALSGVPSDAVIGFAPKLGLSRWIEPSLIQKTAARYGQSVSVPESICVERSAEPLGENAVRQALTTALEKAGYTDYRLVLLDYPRSPLPSGDLDFSLSGLTVTRAGGTGALWRGRLLVGGSQSIPLSVRVDVKVQVSELRAARSMPAGAIIAASDLSVVTRQVPPISTPTSAHPSAAVGMQTRRGLKAGDLVNLRLLTAPPEVQRGERVLVAVTAGRAAVGVEAQAETTARRGQPVVLTNLASGRRFKATVTGRARAAIQLESSNDETMPDPTGSAAADSGSGPGGSETAAATVRVGQNHR